MERKKREERRRNIVIKGIKITKGKRREAIEDIDDKGHRGKS